MAKTLKPGAGYYAGGFRTTTGGVPCKVWSKKRGEDYVRAKDYESRPPCPLTAPLALQAG